MAAARTHFHAAHEAFPSDEYGFYLAWTSFLEASGADVATWRDELERRLMVCLRADRRMAFGHYVAGRLAMVDEDFDTAAKSFKRAYSLDPDLTDAQRSLRLVTQRLSKKR